MPNERPYQILFPRDYLESDYRQFEVENKGYLFGVKLQLKNESFELVFYDISRLQQDSSAEIEENNYFFEPNLIILESVTKKNIELALEKIAQNNETEVLLKD